jgi:GntR family transcriptional regulator, carbon starvation induced regulator
MPVKEETLTKAAVDRLVQEILSGALAPGEKLRIELLKERYQIGASPLREALARLSALGFVVNESRRGFRVASISQKDLQDITIVREMIETTALRRSIEHGSYEWEANIVSALARLRLKLSRLQSKGGELDWLDVQSIHKEFHVALLSGCRSERLLTLQSIIYDQAMRYRYLGFSKNPNMRDFTKSHEVLTEAILSKDVERACAALVRHLRAVSRGYSMFQQQK